MLKPLLFSLLALPLLCQVALADGRDSGGHWDDSQGEYHFLVAHASAPSCEALDRCRSQCHSRYQNNNRAFNRCVRRCEANDPCAE